MVVVEEEATPIHFLVLIQHDLLEEEEVVLLDLIKTIPYHVLEWMELVVVEEEAEKPLVDLMAEKEYVLSDIRQILHK